MSVPPFNLRPGHSVGFICLGASLYDILTALKADVKTFPKLDISYSAQQPLAIPVVVNLPDNGLRLRFDGPDQRLRLIEIVDFHKTRFSYKSEDLIPHQESSYGSGGTAAAPLLYRRVYQLFGPSYPGEFIPPKDGEQKGTYVLSFSGVALSFPLQPSAWSPKVDHATMLSSSASPVSSMAVFEGSSWSDARPTLFTQKPGLPRALNFIPRQKEGMPDEIEHVRIYGAGKLELLRRSSPAVWITMSETTAQDLITDLGPPDAIYKRPGQVDDNPRRPARTEGRRSSAVAARSPYGNSYGSTPSSVSSTNTDTYDADFEEDDGIDGPDIVRSQDQYYCYFQHGFDLLIGPPTEVSEMPRTRGQAEPQEEEWKPTTGSSSVTVTRMILHGNVPGSYSFNQHRRSRWSLEHIGKPEHASEATITSETPFESFHSSLLSAFKYVWPEKDMKEGMVIVRDWGGDSPSGSAVLIGGDMDEDEEETWDKNGDQWLKNTQLYKFPGLMFEVMHNGAVSALTVY